MKRAMLLIGIAVLPMHASAPQDKTPAGWDTGAPREQIKPRFSVNATGGTRKDGSLLIMADQREGQHGWWRKTFAITGGKYYRFHAARKTEGVEAPRRSAIARVLWRDEQDKPVRLDQPVGAEGPLPTAQPEYPVDDDIVNGWVDVGGIYRAPSKATKAIVELHLRWAAGGRVEWADASLTETEAPAPRKVRLAAVHFTPRGGKTPMDNCKMFEPHIAEAAKQKADLVVLGETLTYVGLGKSFLDVSEPIPGPSTEYFCALAKKHQIYLVVGLVERDGDLIYNVAVLIGPDGRIIGKYRKVCLPRGEVDGGLTPGTEYPVFPTKLGKIGMMVCYDGFYPEVARELSKRGAEIICWPVWGCNPILSAARAAENHVYLISSTYTDAKANWTLTAIYGHDGQPMAKAEKWGSVITADVDLSQRHFWRNNLGDFRAEMQRSRPIALPEPKMAR